MAEGGSPPVRDPGGLHMYNINGGAHKLAELVPQPTIGVGLNNPIVNELGMYSDNLSSGYQSEAGLQNNSYIQIEPLRFNDQVGGMYDDMKTQSSQMPSQSYFTNLDNLNNPSNMYEQTTENAYNSTTDLYKSGAGSMGGYIEMLGNSDAMMAIKQEKPDYNDHIGLSTNNHSPETTYASNNCVNEWNYYNAAPSSNNYHEVNAPPMAGNYAMFNVPPNPHTFNPSPMYSGSEMPATLPSNVDIHNQSKKITQSILGLDWNQENLYKSRLYSNVDFENNGRKRKGDSTGNRNVKSRRKKSNDLGGHSKTVASILMSDNNVAVSKKDDSAGKSNLLDSGGRNSLVTKLMDNLRTTVQFESFCLSFPRTKRKENAFRKKVLATATLVQSIASMDIRSSSFPVSYLMGATKLLANFNMALRNMDAKNTVPNDEGDECNTESMNFSVGQVEENLPHSIFWVLKVGNYSISANWEGQFVMAVNPIQEVLTISIFQFQPNFSHEGILCLQQAKLSKDLANDIMENMELFEVSRQLRCDIDLKKVVQLYLYRPYGEQNEGCLVIEVSEKPKYFQRWLHTSAVDKNKWRERTSFISKESERSNQIICIGGLVTELNEVVALMLANSSELKQVYEIGINKTFEMVPSNGFTSNDKNNGNGEDKEIVNTRSHKHKKCIRKLGSNVIKLRKEILEVLNTHRIKDLTVSQTSNVDVKEEGNVDVSLGIYFKDHVCKCFSDYVNYSCDSANELNSILQRKILPRMHGFNEQDFDLEKVPGGDIHQITVGNLLSSCCSDIVYFSFCTMDVGQLGHEHHCSACRKCRTLHFWHCASCDRCSESKSICVYCGHVRDDQSRCVIKPLSVFRSQIVNGTISVDDIKEQWLLMLNLPDNDLVDLSKPTFDSEETDLMEYNSSNAMVDQLGLLNPVGFLLGQPLAGASRRYRRHKGSSLGEKGPVKSEGQSSGSSCSVQ